MHLNLIQVREMNLAVELARVKCEFYGFIFWHDFFTTLIEILHFFEGCNYLTKKICLTVSMISAQ